MVWLSKVTLKNSVPIARQYSHHLDPSQLLRSLTDFKRKKCAVSYYEYCETQ